MGFARVVRGVGLSMLLAQGAFAGELPLSGEVAQSAVEILQPLAENTTKVVSTEVAHIALSPESDAAQGYQQDVGVAPKIQPKLNSESYSFKTTVDDVKAIKWEGLGAFAGITALGVKSWDWGSSGFHFNNEHWFGKNTGSGGSDKLGHAFTSYALTNAFAERLQVKGRSPERAALSASLLSTALMLYVEAFDGVSGDHGFSYEDVVMNSLGIGFAYLRQTNPRFKSLVDFRMEYKPSGYKGFKPLSDYEGQKYLLALKLSGFKSLKQSPLRYFELQAGYYSRGFSKEARNDAQARRQQGFVGIGVNLSQLFFGYPSEADRSYDQVGRFTFEHVQVPYTAARIENKF